MLEKRDVFEKLVEELAVTERRDMLDRLADYAVSNAGDLDDDGEQKSAQRLASDINSRQKGFADANFFVRLWFKIVAFFSASTPEEKYNAYLVAELGRKLNHRYGAYFSGSKRMYTDLLYQQIVSLEDARTFFLPYINEYDKSRGDFYILLSSVIAPDAGAFISDALDPSSEPYETESPKDLHSSYVKKMDETFNKLSAEDKARIYESSQAVEWLSSFEELPLNRYLLQFANTAGSGQMCPIDTLTEDFKKLASVLAAAEKIPMRLLEALFVFMHQDNMQDNGFSFERECTEFVKTAVTHLTSVANFKSRVPIAAFVNFSSEDMDWEPEPERKGEDWFMLFKLAWKDRFEKRFAAWAKLRDKHALNNRSLAFLQCKELPTFDYVPWENSWVEFKFSRESVLLFLKGFFSLVYPKKMTKVFRTILAEGDFYKRENLTEFTDSFNVLEHAKRDIDDFELRLSPKGDIGEGFALAHTEKKGTHSGKLRLDHLMSTVETDAEHLCRRIINAMKSVVMVLGGILNLAIGGQYDSLSNLSSIQGSEGESFRSQISSARNKLEECVMITDELIKH